MPLTVSWKDRNVDIDGTRIYRDTKPIDRDNLPPLLAEVGPGIREYEDADVMRNTLYYYAIAPYKGIDEAVSQVVPLATLPDLGPGPQTLLRGDHECGYFGIVDRVELWDEVSLLETVGFTTSLKSRPLRYWVKYIWQGRICYFPSNAVGEGISWLELYQQGLVYGTDDEGEYPGGVNQQMVLEKGPYQFKVRLPSSVGPGVEGNRTYSEASEGSEWNRIIYPIYSEAPTEINDPTVAHRWTNLTDAEFNANYGHPYYTWAMELVDVTEGNALTRGFRNDNVHRYSSESRTNKNTTLAWRPVLELMP